MLGVGLELAGFATVGRHSLSPTYQVNDFDDVALNQRTLTMLRPGNNFAVHLDRHGPVRQREVLYEAAHRERGCELKTLAIDGHSHTG